MPRPTPSSVSLLPTDDAQEGPRHLQSVGITSAQFRAAMGRYGAITEHAKWMDHLDKNPALLEALLMAHTTARADANIQCTAGRPLCQECEKKAAVNVERAKEWAGGDGAKRAARLSDEAQASGEAYRRKNEE